MKKVLITGACGYLGARLSKYLAEKHYAVTAFDSFDPSGYSQWISLMEEVIVGDIRDETTVSNLTEKQFDVAIHLISLDHHKTENDPNFVSSINVMPTWNLLDKLTKNGLKKFIYFSTIHVYGNLPKEIITEDQIPEPINAYGLTHLLSETICNYFNVKTETKCINIRLSNSYGSPVFSENNCWWLVINDLCKTAFKQSKIKLLSDGSPQRDFIHSSDVCSAIKILVNTDKKDLKKKSYHISSRDTLTIWELAKAVKKIYKKRYNYDIPILLPTGISSKVAAESSDKIKYIVDNSRLKALGFTPKTNLEIGLNDVFDYLEINND